MERRRATAERKDMTTSTNYSWGAATACVQVPYGEPSRSQSPPVRGMPLLQEPLKANGTLLCDFQHPRPEYGPETESHHIETKFNPIFWTQVTNLQIKAVTDGKRAQRSSKA
jgi:hypothetical protein